jgi:hypothetical protein
MGPKIVVAAAILIAFLASAIVLSQASSTPAVSSAGLEFPAVMRQKVIAGATPVGSKVQAKLAEATLVDGVVIPRGALLSGEVTVSVAKSASDPSRLAIRMDSASWKNGPAQKMLELKNKIYLTEWYYPATSLISQAASDDSGDSPSTSRHRNDASPFPSRTNSSPQVLAPPPYPGHDSNRDANRLPGAPNPDSGISQHRILMKNMESIRNPEGGIVITSKGSAIKLDKSTTYVFVAGGVAPK